MSLVRVLSAEPLPLKPPGLDPKVDNYVLQLHEYLRRLQGAFTGGRIKESLEDADISLGVDRTVQKFFHVKTGTNITGQSLDSRSDWTLYDGVCTMRAAAQFNPANTDHMPHGADDIHAVAFSGATGFGIAGFDISGLAKVDIYTNSAGSLLMDITDLVSSPEFYLSVQVFAFGAISPNVANYAQIGDGH
jgi:hypothetical protein